MEETNHQKIKTRVALGLLLIFSPLLVGASLYTTRPQQEQTRPIPDAEWLNLQARINEQAQKFPGQAGVFILDLKTGWVIEHEADRFFPSASLIKMPMMVALFEAEAQGRISLDETLPIQRWLKASGSGKLKYRRNGTKLTLRELIYKMITESDNTATNILTEHFGLEYFNHYFAEIGLKKTNFSRTIMDLRQRNRGIDNYTTPRDMAKILSLIYRGELMGSKTMISILKDQKINDRLSAQIPENWEIGHKTGSMKDSMHDCGIVFSPNRDFIICVLTADLENHRRAKKFIRQIARITTEYYEVPRALPKLQQQARKKSLWSQLFQRRA